MSAPADAPPLAEPSVLRTYALVADGERGAVIGPDGDIGWLCFPSWCDDPLLSSLLGGSPRYVIRPVGRFVWSGQYEDGSLIWRSRWLVGRHMVECHEALAYPAHADEAILVRRVIAVSAPATVDVMLDLGPAAAWEHVDATCWLATVGTIRARWQVPAPVTEREGRLLARLDLEQDTAYDFVLELRQHEIRAEPVNAEDVLRTTRQAWRRSVPPLGDVAAPRDARHAVAVLRGLTTHSGAMVAAATTSLPEHARRGRDYDYRYSWIRDQCYVGLAAALDLRTAEPLLDAAVQFVHERLLCDGMELKPVYRADGGPVPAMTEVDLPGYPGSERVVFGNRARDQFQLDIFGEALSLFAAAAERDRMHGDAWRAARIAVDAIAAKFDQPDAGIWEVTPARYTHSRFECVAGLRRLAATAPRGAESSRWLALADAIMARLAETSVHHTGRWQRAPDDPRVDASLLVGALRHATAPDDPRALATLESVRRELQVDGYVFRYAVDDQPLGTAEGAFLLCGCWLALACWQSGDAVTALRLFERHRAACGPPGLFAEEYDVNDRQLRGEFPQAFVHALLLECALTFSEERA